MGHMSTGWLFNISRGLNQAPHYANLKASVRCEKRIQAMPTKPLSVSWVYIVNKAMGIA